MPGWSLVKVAEGYHDHEAAVRSYSSSRVEYRFQDYCCSLRYMILSGNKRNGSFRLCQHLLSRAAVERAVEEKTLQPLCQAVEADNRVREVVHDLKQIME
ncbi:uncharacterized protein UV8b_07559 [Ustilaginoidea virens]|uniref:Uncharacterized protein n=1 Tax=Ustilaginoidea virens TaxID=1159556 RepID=A0A8E5HXW3_USTVR|nr:uncharacterized protein UV8b_07559 [Ustilaginoidea virens]QUC23318.1 hypothetical protein UV8b_07559 [Ustilaginoidea virens]